MKKLHCLMAVSLPVLALLAGCQGEARMDDSLRPVEVKVMEVVTGFPAGRNYPGTVEEENGTPLSFAVSGTVKTLHVSLGQHVRSGQLIATLDTVSLQNAHRLAQAALHQAEDACRRMKELHDKGSLPDMKWVEVQSQVEQARSAERIAAKNLADSRLYAPFAGMIAEKSVEVGQNVMPGVPVARLVTTSRLKVKISVPEAEIASVSVGQQATVSVQALGGGSFEARVAEKGVVAHPLSRSYDVKLQVASVPEGLLPGMVADVSLQPAGSEGRQAACVIPAGVVQIDEQNRTFVWTVDAEGKARKRVIGCGEYLPDGVAVSSGLAAGDRIIVEGQQKVCNGTPVTII